MRPFEPDDARVMALYRIPTPPGAGRVLEVSIRPPGVLGRYPWPGGLAVTLTIGSPAAMDRNGSSSGSRHRMAVVGSENLPFLDGSFDMLILHGTLEHLQENWPEGRQGAQISRFLSSATTVLVPGGLVAGCVKNRRSLSYNIRKLGVLLGVKRFRARAASLDRRRFSVPPIRRVLERAGLIDVELFSLFPDDRSPTLLFERDGEGVRPHLIRNLQARRQELSAWSYLAQHVVVRWGPKNLRCESIFFWGRKN